MAIDPSTVTRSDVIIRPGAVAPIIPPKWTPRSREEYAIAVDNHRPYQRSEHEEAIAKEFGAGHPVIQGRFTLRIGSFPPMECTFCAIAGGPKFVMLPADYYRDTQGLEAGSTEWTRALAYWGHAENQRLHDRVLAEVGRVIEQYKNRSTSELLS